MKWLKETALVASVISIVGITATTLSYAMREKTNEYHTLNEYNEYITEITNIYEAPSEEFAAILRAIDELEVSEDLYTYNVYIGIDNRHSAHTVINIDDSLIDFIKDANFNWERGN